MENCLEGKIAVDSVVISKDQMWELSQDLLYCFTDNMNDYAIPENVSFSEIWPVTNKPYLYLVRNMPCLLGLVGNESQKT